MTRPVASGHIRHARERGTPPSSSDRAGGAGFAGRTAVGPRIRVHGNDPQERTCAHCPSGRGAARSPRRRRRDRDAGRKPGSPRCTGAAPAARASLQLRNTGCAGDGGAAWAGRAAGAGPATGRARAAAQPRGGSDRRRSCGRCGSRAGRGRRRARERCRARPCRRARRARHGGVGAGQHGGRQARAHLQACIVRATGARRMMRRWSERPGCSGISCRGVSSVGSRAAGSAPRAPLGPGTRSRVVHRCSARLCGHVRSPPLRTCSARVAPSSMRTPP